MKNNLLLTAAMVLVATSASAMDFHQYASARLSFAQTSYDFKWGTPGGANKSGKKELKDNSVWGGSVAYGVKAKSLRAELELNLKDEAKDKYFDSGDGVVKGGLENRFVMFNAYYDFDTGTKFTPYVGAGFGWAELKAKMSATRETYSKSKTNFVWQVGAGISYALTDNVRVDLGYRYLDEGHLTYRDNVGFNRWKAQSHEASLGVRYMF